jgi:hypothetical protein
MKTITGCINCPFNHGDSNYGSSCSNPTDNSPDSLEELNDLYRRKNNHRQDGTNHVQISDESYAFQRRVNKNVFEKLGYYSGQHTPNNCPLLSVNKTLVNIGVDIFIDLNKDLIEDKLYKDNTEG